MTMGCIRKTAQAFMVVEVFIVEMDIAVKRIYDENIGFSPITFE